MTRHPVFSGAFAEHLSALASADSQQIESAREALVAGGGSAVRALVRTLDTDDDRLRVRAIGLLGLLGDARAARPLAALLFDHSATVRRAAAGALARISSEVTVPALVGYLRREPALGLRRVAVRALVRLVQTGHEEPIRALLDVAADTEQPSSLRAAALDAMPFIAVSDDESSVAASRTLLLGLANEPAAEVATKARRLLDSSELPRVEPWAMERLLRDLASERQHVWRRALALLGRIGGAVTEPTVQALLAHPQDREFARRCVLVLRGLSSRQLARLGPHLDAVADPIPLEALVEIAASCASRALLARLAALIDRLAALSERDGPQRTARARARAHLALARAGSRLAISDLRRILEDPRFPIGPDVIEAASTIGTRHELSSLLRAYMRTRGVHRLALHDAFRDVAQRERIRRTDRTVAVLPADERRAAMQILGASPQNGARRRRLQRLTGTPFSG